MMTTQRTMIGVRRARTVARAFIEIKRAIAAQREAIRARKSKVREYEQLLLPYVRTHGELRVDDALIGITERASNAYAKRCHAMRAMLLVELPRTFAELCEDASWAPAAQHMLDIAIDHVEREIARVETETHKTITHLIVHDQEI